MKKILLIAMVVVIGIFYFIYNKEVITTAPVVPDNTIISVAEEKILVEKYVRDNIKTIAPEEPVLGGSWYVTTININPSLKTGDMTYEDGHIEGKATFIYVLNGEKVSISAVQKIVQ